MIRTAGLGENETINPYMPKNSNALTAVFDRITDAFAAFDIHWNYIYVNKKAAEILGREPRELIGRNIWDEFPDKKEHPFYKNFLTAINEQRTIRAEGYYAPLKTWFNATLYPSPAGLSVYFQNITSRKKAEQELAETQEKYRQIVGTAQEGIWMIDENNKTIFVNQKLGDILGYSIEEMTGKENTFFMDEEDRELSSKSITRRRKGIIENLDKQLITKSGNRIRVNMSANPIFDGEGKYKGALAMVSDITEKVKLQQQLIDEQIDKQKQITRAEINAREKERTRIGQELHDNINQLLSASNLFLGHSLVTNDYKKFILKSKDCNREAIEEIRKLSKALTGPSKVETMGLVTAVTDLLNDLLLVKNITLHFNTSTFVEEGICMGLKVVIYRIIQEQLNNILKHAEATRVSIALTSGKGLLTLSIKDNGSGFNKAAKRKGIGLTNITGRASAYNGKVDISSSPGNGCNMQVIFNLQTTVARSPGITD